MRLPKKRHIEYYNAFLTIFLLNRLLILLVQLADLTGELMRLAIGRISDGELEFAQKICSFVREIHRELTLIAPKMDDASDMKTKMDIMLQSVMKIENGNDLSILPRGVGTFPNMLI